DNATAKPKPVALQRPQALFSQASFPIQNAIDNNPATGWGTAPRFGQPNVAVFEVKQPITNVNSTKLTFTLDQGFGGQHTIGRFRLSVTTVNQPVSLTGP